MVRLGVKIAEALAECVRAIDEDAAKRKAACEEYANHLADGGDPHARKRYGSKFQGVTADEAMRLDAARREAIGLPPTPYPPGSDAYRPFDLLVKRLGEFVPIADIQAVAGGYTRNPQIPTLIREMALRKAGYVLDKGRVGGKTAYRLIEREVEDGG